MRASRKERGRPDDPIPPFDHRLAERPARSGTVSPRPRDRACLALAESLDATALTTKRVWRNVKVGARIELIR